MTPKQLPTGWKEVELSKVIKLRGGYAFKSEKFVEQGIPIIRISNFDNNNVNLSGVVYYSKEDSRTYNEFLLKENDILIAMSGATTGKIGVIIKENEPCLLNQRVGKFEIIDKNIFFKYLLMFVKSSEFQKKVFNIASGCAQPNISGKQIESIKIPLPPLPIQKQIVSILEKAEALKQRREKADKLTKEYLKSVFAEMFLKNGFEEKELEKVADIIMGQSPPGNSYNEKGEGTPFFQGKAEFTEKYPLIKKWTTKPSKLAEPNSILISVRAPVGDVNLCNVKCCIGRGLASIKPIKKLANLYYIYFLLQSIKDKIEYLGSGSTFKAINSRQLRNLKIPLPPLPLQQKFANIVEKVEKLKEKQKQSKEEINLMFDALMQKAFKGELVR